MDGKSCGAKYKNVIPEGMLLLFERSNLKMIGIGNPFSPSLIVHSS